MDSRTTDPVQRIGASWRSARGPLLEALLLAVLSLSLNLLGNGRISLWDRDEPRYAGCTREMRASGDWVHPTFNAEPRYHKPVLIYWLMLAGTALGGDNPFGARLVSSLAGTSTVLLVWLWGRRVLGEIGGRLAGLVLATAPLMVAESKMATTDATLALWVVGCQFALWELARRPSKVLAGVFWTLLGLAVLTKSPAGPVLIAVSALASWWWGGPSACWRRLHWRWGLAIAAAIVVPWNIAILIRSGGAYYDVAVGYHIIRRATNGIEEHGGFPGYYVVVGMGTLFPWSALIPAAMYAAWRKRRETPIAGFLLGWMIGPLVLLEVVRTKLIHYYLPAVPAIALLIGWLGAILAREATGAWPRTLPFKRLAFGVLATIGGLATLAALYGVVRLPLELGLPLLTLSLLVASTTGFGLWQLTRGVPARIVPGFAVGSALIMAVLAGWFLPRVEPYRISAVVGKRLAALEETDAARSVLCTFQAPGTVYALGHPAPILRSRDEIREQVDLHGRVVTALNALEFHKVSADERFLVEFRETVTGFNVDKGRQEVLHLVRIQANPAQAELARETPAKVVH